MLRNLFFGPDCSVFYAENKRLLDKAKNGDSAAQLELSQELLKKGYLYEGKKWGYKAIKNGKTDGYYSMALSIMYSEKFQEYREETIKILKEGVNKNCVLCQTWLGEKLVTAESESEYTWLQLVPNEKKDVNIGLSLLNQAAQAGHKPAQSFLARFYDPDISFDIKYRKCDVALAKKWYLELAKESISMMIAIAMYHNRGAKGFEKSEAESLKWVEKVAKINEADDPRALYRILDACYHLGKQAEKNKNSHNYADHVKKAFYWYLKAASIGYDLVAENRHSKDVKIQITLPKPWISNQKIRIDVPVKGKSPLYDDSHWDPKKIIGPHNFYDIETNLLSLIYAAKIALSKILPIWYNFYCQDPQEVIKGLTGVINLPFTYPLDYIECYNKPNFNIAKLYADREKAQKKLITLQEISPDLTNIKSDPMKDKIIKIEGNRIIVEDKLNEPKSFSHTLSVENTKAPEIKNTTQNNSLNFKHYNEALNNNNFSQPIDSLKNKIILQKQIIKNESHQILFENKLADSKNTSLQDIQTIKNQLAKLKLEHVQLYADYESKSAKYVAEENFKQHPNLYSFYRAVYINIEKLFISCKAIGEFIETSKQGNLGNVVNGVNMLKHLAGLMPFIGNSIEKVINAASVSLEMIDHTRQTNILMAIADLGTLSDIKKAAEKTARELTECYETQLKLLPTEADERKRSEQIKVASFTGKIAENGKSFIETGRSVILKEKLQTSAQALAVFAISLIMGALLDGTVSSNKALSDQFITAVTTKPSFADRIKYAIFNALGMASITTIDNRIWQLQCIFRLPGIKTPDGEYYGGGMSNADLYDYCLSTADKAKELKLTLIKVVKPSPKLAKNSPTFFASATDNKNSIPPMQSPSLEDFEKHKEEIAMLRKEIVNEKEARWRLEQRLKDSEERKFNINQFNIDVGGGMIAAQVPKSKTINTSLPQQNEYVKLEQRLSAAEQYIALFAEKNGIKVSFSADSVDDNSSRNALLNIRHTYK